MPKRTIAIAGKRVTLDARPDRLDLRDLPYRPPVRSLEPQYPNDKEISQLLQKYNAAGLILDQGTEGACTGFGLAAVINFLLWIQSDYKLTKNDKVSTRMLYHLARFYDEWPGEDYQGSSCRGALKGWHRHGVCLETKWPFRDKARAHFIRPVEGWDSDALLRPLGVYYRIDRKSVVDMQAAILDVGAIYVSANVHDGWEIRKKTGKVTHATLPVIQSSLTGIGGHAFALVGYNDIGFVVQNSWGSGWAANGFAVLPYDDWAANGTDAWVVSLGSPVRKLEQRQFFVRSRNAAAQVRAKSGLVDSAIGQARADGWSEEQAYWHTVVTGNDGHVINRLPQVENESDNVAFVAYEQPLKWFKDHHTNDVWRLAIYAHGGLNSEADSINRIRVLGPHFISNGIYPVFTTWKSGWNEILGNLLEDGVNKLFGSTIVPSRGLGDMVTEVSDRTLEVFLRNLLGKSIWSEMKENVVRSTNQGRGLDTLANQLTRLADQSNQKLEIHLMGHSAGSFVCGKLLAEFRERGLMAKTCTLYAPACDLKFALDHFKTAIDNKRLVRSDFRVHVLSDKLELDDTVGPYQKSLLYLVSRALDRWHKTPLLGLISAFDGGRAMEEYWHDDTIDNQVKAWQNFFWGGIVPKGFARSGNPAPGSNLFVLSASQVNVGPRRIKSSHGCFDNSIDIVGDTLSNILGAKLKQPITDLDY